jgi:glycosyltransferase involved in cell wall biosynthesis
MSDLPSVSLIIPCYNEAFHLRECLSSLLAQDYPDFEVILVDNGSTDETVDICHEFPELRYIYFDRVASSYAARNTGAKAARGEVLAFFDADQRAEPNYLKSVLSEYASGDPYHIYCAKMIDDPRVPEVLRMSHSFPSYSDRTVLTATLFVPMSLFQELGGFKEAIKSGGDIEFFERASKVATVHRGEIPVARHYWARDVSELFERVERYGFGIGIKAKEAGKPAPSIVAASLRTAGMAATKLAVVGTMPLRKPYSQWSLYVRTQWTQVASEVYFVKGMIKHRLGYKRAGDLPKDPLSVGGAREALAQK